METHDRFVVVWHDVSKYPTTRPADDMDQSDDARARIEEVFKREGDAISRALTICEQGLDWGGCVEVHRERWLPDEDGDMGWTGIEFRQVLRGEVDPPIRL